MAKRILTVMIISALILIGLEFASKFIFIRYCVGESDCEAEASILYIGDSQGVELAPRVRSKLKPKYNVISSCENGLAPDAYLARLSLLDDYYKPDLIMISICATNDISDLRLMVEKPLQEKIKLYLGRHSYFYNVLKTVYFNAITRCRLGKRHFTVAGNQVILVDSDGKIKPIDTETNETSSDFISEDLLLKSRLMQDSWNMFERLAKEMSDIAKRRGVPLIFICLPDPIQVDERYKSMYVDSGFEVPEDFVNKPVIQDRLNTMCVKNGIIVIDLLLYLQSKDDHDLFYENNPHFNDRGAEIVSDYVINVLRRSDVIK
ncbi:MAG: hypothetical protein JW800_07105 [Candidatus Omnitrophica bacterium]|nr:hypothetical protein [Candidatus Omnitrophota bacterium]